LIKKFRKFTIIAEYAVSLVAIQKIVSEAHWGGGKYPQWAFKVHGIIVFDKMNGTRFASMPPLFRAFKLNKTPGYN
jgi:hypothetical protein